MLTRCVPTSCLSLQLKLAAADASTEVAQQIGKILIRLRGQQETLQQQRQKAEEAKSTAAGRVTEAQAVMRAAVELRSTQREAILNASTMRVSLLGWGVPRVCGIFPLLDVDLDVDLFLPGGCGWCACHSGSVTHQVISNHCVRACVGLLSQPLTLTHLN
jgi:hypothetical protein